MTKSPSFGRRRLVDEVIDHLRVEISSGRLASGSRLPPEAKLTSQLGVSRTTLREAMVVLSHDGLVDVRQGDGTYVKPAPVGTDGVPKRSVAELLEAKRTLFVGLVRLAAARRTDLEADELDQQVAALSRAIEAGQEDEINRRTAVLESGIAAAAHSDLLADFARQVSSSLDAVTASPSDHAEPLPASVGYLARTARAVVDGDAESADRHIRLWLSARATALAPEQTRTEYIAPGIRHGPRTSHGRRTIIPGSAEPRPS